MAPAAGWRGRADQASREKAQAEAPARPPGLTRKKREAAGASEVKSGYLRAKLLAQLNTYLQTRIPPRGLHR